MRKLNNSTMLQEICDKLNNTDWQELGFVCDGRFLCLTKKFRKLYVRGTFWNAISFYFMNI